MLLGPRFPLFHDVTGSVDGHRKLKKRPPYSHYSAPIRPPCSQRKGVAKCGSRRVLKKRRRFTDSPRLKLPIEQLRPISLASMETMQKPTPRPSLPLSTSASKHTPLLPSLRTNSLRLTTPTQPLRIRKRSESQSTSTHIPPALGDRPGSYTISNSPILPIGGNIPSRSITPRTYESSPSTPVGKLPSGAGAQVSTSTFNAFIHTGLETLIASVESEFQNVQRPSSPRPVSVATSLSVYSQASAAYSVPPEPRGFDQGSITTCEDKKDGEHSDKYSIRSVETLQLTAPQDTNVDKSQFSTSPDMIHFNVDPPRLSTSTSTSMAPSDITTPTLVDPATPTLRKDKKHLESTRLSLQPCPSLATAHRILSLSDLPPSHDAPSPIDENTYRRYEYEGKFDSPFNDDICADCDYIYASDVVTYGARPLPDVPVDIARHSSNRFRSKQENSIRRRGSDRRPAPAVKKTAHTDPPVSFNRKLRKNGVKADAQTRAHKMEGRCERKVQEERRSIFFQVTHLFGKPSSSVHC